MSAGEPLEEGGKGHVFHSSRKAVTMKISKGDGKRNDSVNLRVSELRYKA